MRVSCFSKHRVKMHKEDTEYPVEAIILSARPCKRTLYSQQNTSHDKHGVKKSHLNMLVWVLLPYIITTIQQVSKFTLPR